MEVLTDKQTYGILICYLSTKNPLPPLIFYLKKLFLTLRGPNQTSFLTLLGILQGALTLRGPILNHFPNSAG